MSFSMYQSIQCIVLVVKFYDFKFLSIQLLDVVLNKIFKREVGAFPLRFNCFGAFRNNNNNNNIQSTSGMFILIIHTANFNKLDDFLIKRFMIRLYE